jgi:starch synthase (maltosyl-transferring)
MVPPKIYHLHPLVAGPPNEWPRHLARIRAMGFDFAASAPLFVPGAGGDIFLTADHEALHPALGFQGPADEGIAQLASSCAVHELRLLLDLVIDHVASEATLLAAHPEWFHGNEPSPDSPDPRRPRPPAGTAEARFDNGLTDWWAERLARLVRCGVAGFRCLHPDRVPPHVWSHLIEYVRHIAPETLFIGWTPGVPREAVPSLAGLGFDRTASSLAWWDLRAPWFLEEAEILRQVAPPIASPEPSFQERLASRLGPDADTAAGYRRALRLAAAIASGMLVPMGFEYAARRPFDPVVSGPHDFEQVRQEAWIDLTEEVREANRLVDAVASICPDGQFRSLIGPDSSITALLRAEAPDIRRSHQVVAIFANPSLTTTRTMPFPLDHLPPTAGREFGHPSGLNGSLELRASLSPGEVRLFRYQSADPVLLSRPRLDPHAPRLAIEAVSPAVENGRFAAKRLANEAVTVSADILMDGHEVLGAALLWRPADQTEWRRETMSLTVNDRWEGVFTPERIGRHLFAIEAWWDEWGTFRHRLEAKLKAGQDVGLDVQEGLALLRTITAAAPPEPKAVLESTMARGDSAALLAEDTRQAEEAAGHHPFAIRSIEYPLDADRPQAMFSSWYELFPRSVTSDPSRHGTLLDVMAVLPRIRDLGFDVLYFPPIHPIGHTNRKGPNNSLRAEPGNLGSPYAIGAEEGGHDAIHPFLGTLKDFRALVEAAADHGLEIALDFAIQCSLDHPWIREHPGWFRWRPDGSVKYAENPPKRYEDIVNVDFYAEGAIPDLWLALRDVVRFWTDNGVRIFRVDNPHTKPLPFWEWMIADLHATDPDVVFLSEAFTRPKMMYRLAKVGFTQSYTYFTWRNTKQEMTDYLTELNTAPVRDCFRPNFFVNTPDINPYFLQTSGRAGFLIRAALATTLSGNWGMYSGFELCESAPLPGREEYLDSEKYEIRVRDYNAPGNITNEIRLLNRLRRHNPALQTHLGVQFLPAFNDHILLFGKRAPGARAMILVAICFDPYYPQDADIEIPLWQWGLADHDPIAVEDLIGGHNWVWHGKSQHIRLDPAFLPFLIYRLTPTSPAA